MTATGATYIDVNVDLLNNNYFSGGSQSTLGYANACCNRFLVIYSFVTLGILLFPHHLGTNMTRPVSI